MLKSPVVSWMGQLNKGFDTMQFISDLINLTQGQLLIKYWWLWLVLISLFGVYIYKR